MSPIEPSHDRLRDYAERYCDGTLSAEETAVLERQLRDDPQALEFFVLYLEIHSQIAWNVRAHAEDEGGGAREPLAVGGETETFPPPSALPAPPSSIPPIVLDSSSSFHPPLFTLHSPLGSFLFSYAVAAVLLGIVLLAGLAWRISRSPQVAQSEPLPGAERQVVEAEPPSVGHISGTRDCRWVDPAAKVSDRDPVPLGRKFVLRSGLVEIAYNSGARVILQGPAIFEVQSATGGFLSLGKLTARVEAWGERTANLTFSSEKKEPTTSLAPRPSPGEKPKIQNPKSRISKPSPLPPLPSPLFSVRTPTAIVTDLGTEFGVEVERTGATRSHVFQGRIEVLVAAGRSGDGRPVQLGVGETAWVGTGSHQAIAVIGRTGEPLGFVRQMPTRPSSGPPQAGPASATTPAYRLTDLGTLGGATSRAYDINAAGQVAGSADLAGGVTHAFLYNNGKMEDLDPASANRSDAFRINSSGKVVGAAQSTDQRLCAFLYSDGKLTYLQRANAMASAACGINSKAIIVGVVTDAQGAAHAFRSDGVQAMTFLTTEFRSWVTDISDRDQAVGYLAAGDGAMRAFVCDGRVMKKLDNLGGGSSYANRINRLGQVAGCCDVSGGNAHAVLWDAAGVHDLGTLGGGNSRAEGINSEGHVVGGAHDASGDVHAFLYAGGVMSDLNALIPPASGWTLRIAMAINDSGQIVGNGLAPDGNTRAFLLTPSAVVARSPDRAAEGRGDLRSQPWHGQETVPQRVAPEGERRGQPMN